MIDDKNNNNKDNNNNNNCNPLIFYIINYVIEYRNILSCYEMLYRMV